MVHAIDLRGVEKPLHVLTQTEDGRPTFGGVTTNALENTGTIMQHVRHDVNARVHVMSHVLHYGSSVFEGIRCYSTKRGPAILRLREHMQRFLNSAKIYRMDHPWTLDQLCDAAIELVRQSGMDQCYIRPILFRSLDEEHPAFGVNPFPNP